MKKILIIDDEEGVRESLKFSLKDKYRTFLASTGKEGIQCIKKENPDLVILDILLPDKNGLEILKEIKKVNNEIPVIMLTAVSQVKTAVEAMKLGAIDYITKPYDVDELLILIKNILKSERLKQQIIILKEEISKEYPIKKIIFRSKVMREIIEKATRLSSTDSTVLLLGPTGVGKELIARFIHFNGPRKEEPFIPVHCAAIPETLFESELFGHEKGAFTNAFQRKIGKFELAGTGTIFLDEISEIPLSMQTKLLRFLEERKFTRLGGNEFIKSEARIISASSKDLKEEIKKGKFRDDLYYRLGVVPIWIPPLRERKEDIRVLVEFYFEYFRKQLGCDVKSISEEAMEVFENYDWPGNVRELKNIIERILVLKGEKYIIEKEDLPEELFRKEEKKGLSLKEKVEEYEKELILDALRKSNWNKSKAARILKTTRRIISYKMKKFNIGER